MKNMKENYNWNQMIYLNLNIGILMSIDIQNKFYGNKWHNLLIQI